MKKTAGELIETIAVEEERRGDELRFVAWCPVCGKEFFSNPSGSTAEAKATVVNTAVTHIRCVHPEV